MRTQRHMATIATVSLLALVACGTSDNSKPAPSPSIGISDLGIDTDGGIPPEPTGADRAAYLAAVRNIDPALADTELYGDATLISAGRDACQLIHQDATPQAPVDNVVTTLSTTDWTASTAQAQRLVDAAREDICPSY